MPDNTSDPTLNSNRIRARIAGRTAAREVLELGEHDVEGGGVDFGIAYWETIRTEATLALARLGVKMGDDREKRKPKEQPPANPWAAKKEKQDGELPDDVRKALALVSEMENLADEIEWEDAPDVLERAQSIGRTIERANSVTDGQMAALENMRDAMARWTRD